MIISTSKSDLESYVKVKDYEEAKLKAYYQGIADATKWIPCSERLPKEEGLYLVSTKYRGCVVAFFTYGSFYWAEYVTAWMQLPEPYKEQMKGEQNEI